MPKMLDLGFAATIYFDADVFIYWELGAIFETLASNSIALTPHITEPLPDDDRLPRDFTILRAGAFNLGFIGVRDTPEARRFLDWWAACESRYGHVDPLHGWSGDQKWCDMVPALFDGVAVLKNRGLNVAYWNLLSRPLSQVQGRWFAGGEPLVFFHFSGFDPKRPGMLSKFQDRIDPSHDPLLSRLLAGYAAELSDCERRVLDILHPSVEHDSAEPATKGLLTQEVVDSLLANPLEEVTYGSSVRVSPREVFAEPGESVVFQVEICNRANCLIQNLNETDSLPHLRNLNEMASPERRRGHGDEAGTLRQRRRKNAPLGGSRTDAALCRGPSTSHQPVRPMARGSSLGRISHPFNRAVGIAASAEALLTGAPPGYSPAMIA